MDYTNLETLTLQKYKKIVNKTIAYGTAGFRTK